LGAQVVGASYIVKLCGVTNGASGF